MIVTMIRKLLFTLAAAVLIAVPADAKSHKRKTSASRNAPGQFDYYLLTLSWAPDFCDSHPDKQNNRECGRGNHTGFIVHGLWPQFEAGGYPKQCAPARPVSSDIVTRMLPLMTDAGLIQHEWSDHGTCSGLDQNTYFDTVSRAFASVKIPGDLTNLKAPLSVTPAALDAKFVSANPSLTGAVHTECSMGEVSEVRICFTKDLKARACGNGVSDCSAGTLKMLPPR